MRDAGVVTMSFRDLAGDVGIKSACVHYHFPTKSDLGEALVDRYSRLFKDRLDRIDTVASPTPQWLRGAKNSLL